MSWLDFIEMGLALGVAVGFWLYVLAAVSIPIAGLFGFAAVVGLAEQFLSTFILYFFITACFLLFWPNDSGSPLD